jgi:hypothetical protein
MTNRKNNTDITNEENTVPDSLRAVPDAPEPIDPYDVDALRALQPDIIVTEHVRVSIAVRRPNRTEFFRVNPDPAYSIDWTVIERDGDGGRETYWVSPALRAVAPTEIRPVRIFTCVNKRGTVFLWPARLPSIDNALGRRWHESALNIADHAKSAWVKMVGDRGAGAYEMYRARGDYGDPVWPDSPLRELLKLAFGDGRTIDRVDHPVLLELNGEL